MNGAVRRASALEDEQLRGTTPILNMARSKKVFPVKTEIPYGL